MFFHLPRACEYLPMQYMNHVDLSAQARSNGLCLLGGFHPSSAETLLLVGPDPQTFWPILQAAPEATRPDPVDRWSQRVLTAWASQIGATALFPFGQPRQPFIAWALQTNRCHLSPVNLLVHDTQGLMVSFRGALLLPKHITLPEPPPNPCDTCATKPCATACPVDALRDTYDTAACKGELARPASPCLSMGCAARRACPVSPPRPHAQSEHHMKHFLT